MYSQATVSAVLVVIPEPTSWMGQTIFSKQCERCSARRRSHTRTLSGWGRPTELVGALCVPHDISCAGHMQSGKDSSWGAPVSARIVECQLPPPDPQGEAPDPQGEVG